MNFRGFFAISGLLIGFGVAMGAGLNLPLQPTYIPNLGDSHYVILLDDSKNLGMQYLPNDLIADQTNVALFPGGNNKPSRLFEYYSGQDSLELFRLRNSRHNTLYYNPDVSYELPPFASEFRNGYFWTPREYYDRIVADDEFADYEKKIGPLQKLLNVWMRSGTQTAFKKEATNIHEYQTASLDWCRFLPDGSQVSCADNEHNYWPMGYFVTLPDGLHYYNIVLPDQYPSGSNLVTHYKPDGEQVLNNTRQYLSPLGITLNPQEALLNFTKWQQFYSTRIDALRSVLAGTLKHTDAKVGLTTVRHVVVNKDDPFHEAIAITSSPGSDSVMEWISGKVSRHYRLGYALQDKYIHQPNYTRSIERTTFLREALWDLGRYLQGQLPVAQDSCSRSNHIIVVTNNADWGERDKWQNYTTQERDYEDAFEVNEVKTEQAWKGTFERGSGPSRNVGDDNGDGVANTLADYARALANPTPAEGDVDDRTRWLSPVRNDGINDCRWHHYATFKGKRYTWDGQNCYKTIYDIRTHSNQTLLTSVIAYGLGDYQDVPGELCNRSEGTATGRPDNVEALGCQDPALTADNEIDKTIYLKNKLTPTEYLTDLRNAARDGRGKFYKANTPKELERALEKALAAVSEPTGAPVATSAGELDEGGYVFKTEYTPGNWTGDLLAYRWINQDGNLVLPTEPIWRASTRARPATERIIFTYDSEWNIPIVLAAVCRNEDAYDGRYRDITACARRYTPGRSDNPVAYTSKADGAKPSNNFNMSKRTVKRLSSIWRDQTFSDSGSGTHSFDNIASSETSAMYNIRYMGSNEWAKTNVKGPIGDIIHSEPIYVGKPPFDNYSDEGYKAFQSLHTDRMPIVYVGSNDGFLHGYRVSDGKELFAYLPSMKQTYLNASSKKGVNDAYLVPGYELTGGGGHGDTYEYSYLSPDHKHYYGVDGSPLSADINNGNGWKTILTTTLGFGGRGIFTLDITDPEKFTLENYDANVMRYKEEADGSDKWEILKGPRFSAEAHAVTTGFLWEFEAVRQETYDSYLASQTIADHTASGDIIDASGIITTVTIPGPNDYLGYVLHRPSVVRVKAPAGGSFLSLNSQPYRWVVAIGNGYNSLLDRSALMLFQADNDQLYTVVIPVPVSENDTAQATGLSAPAFGTSRSDPITTLAYAGDLQGKLWKFDLEQAASWTTWPRGENPNPDLEAIKLLTATDQSGNLQPITAQPLILNNESGRMGDPKRVLVGTGKLITHADQRATRNNTFYSVKDDGTAKQRSDLCEYRLINLSGIAAGATERTYQKLELVDAECDPLENGWYIDLSTGTGERVVERAALGGGNVFFAAKIPDVSDCTNGGTGRIIGVNAVTGAPPEGPIFDINGDGILNELDMINGEYPSAFTTSNMPTAPEVVINEDGTGEIVFGDSSGDLNRIHVDAGGATIQQNNNQTPGGNWKRNFWRYLRW